MAGLPLLRSRTNTPAHRLARGGVAAALATAVLAAPWAVQQAAAGSCLPAGATPSISPSKTDNALRGVTSVSACDVWAVGSFQAGQVAHTLIEHWDGKTWSRSSSPNPGGSTGDSELLDVSAVSASDVWATGSFSTAAGVARTFVVHWNGSKWSRVASPNAGGASIGNTLASIDARSARDVWAVGSFGDVSTSNGGSSSGSGSGGSGTSSVDYVSPLIEHWNGTRWTRVAAIASPSAELTSVSALGARDAWAVGRIAGSSGSQALTLHWNGTRWVRVAGARLAKFATLTGVAGVAHDNVWAVGTTQSSSGGPANLVEHWNGTRWVRIAAPTPGGAGTFNLLMNVTVTPRGSVWVAGNSFNLSTGAVHGYTLHRSGTSWTRTPVRTPAGASGTAASDLSATSNADVWVVGSGIAGTDNSQQATTLASHIG